MQQEKRKRKVYIATVSRVFIHNGYICTKLRTSSNATHIISLTLSNEKGRREANLEVAPAE